VLVGGARYTTYNNNSNNSKLVYRAPQGRNFSGTDGSQPLDEKSKFSAEI